MTAAALLSLLIALAKALPAFDSILKQVNAALVEHRRTQAHARIQDAVAAAQAAPWVCPASCPHRLLYAEPAAQPGGLAPGTS